MAENEALRKLIAKWRAKANHPQRQNRPEERAAFHACADDLLRLVVDDTAATATRDGGPRKLPRDTNRRLG